MSRTVVLSLYLLLRPFTRAELSQLGPSFVLEPPSLVQYPVSSGTRVACVTRGDPAPGVSWLGDDGALINDIAGVRKIHKNGTLEILPGSVYRGSQVTATYRCRASNAHGTVLSRDVTMQPVSEESWEPMVSAWAAAEGGVAALSCSAEVDRHGFIEPAVWYRGDRVLNVDPPRPDSRHIMAGNTLLIRDVSAGDAGAYSCVARHRITGHTKRSRPAHLTVTTGSLGSAPRLSPLSGDVTASAGGDFCAPCVASGHPAPLHTWYRESNGRLQPVELSLGHTWLWGGGAALCATRAIPDVTGAWLCKAHNAYGDATAQMRIEIRDQLAVEVVPKVQIADTGSTVRFNCTPSDPSASIRWLHDGVPVGGASRELLVRGVTRAHKGMYQCFARRAHDGAQATAELRLGDTAPELHYTFIEQALRAGGSVSLRCAASGAPAPRFEWLLDDQPVDQYLAAHRYSVEEQTSAGGDVVSVLNVSAPTAADGGRYSCRAHNALGRVQHSARLNIYGPPSVRALGPVRAVAGANATVLCPYAGYPISSITWWSRGSDRALPGSGRVSAKGPELRLTPAVPADGGPYACSVVAPDGTAARRDIEIQVRNPPKISPYIFSTELTEGSSVQVLCGVSSGDKPMYFSWLKDGEPIPTSLQIQEKSLDEFSLLMFTDLTAKHSGAYTCSVSNHAATVNYTATLSVKVTPSWISEPTDSAVLLGAPISLECSAKGYPPPTITWYRKLGDSLITNDGVNEQWEEMRVMGWNSDTITTYNGTLKVASAARAHQGVYRCKADNGVGPPLMKQINVTVHEPAHFDTMDSTNVRNLTCVRGQSAALVCHARGDPPLRAHWTHRGRRLDVNSYRAVVSEVRTAEGLRSTLQLRAAERADAGEYRCHAENEYGRSELLVYLYVEEPPEAPKSLQLGGASSRWIRMLWKSSASRGVLFSALCTALHTLPGSDVRQRVLNLTAEPVDSEERSDANDAFTFTAKLDGLRPATAYSLKLVASNHVGQSPHSKPLLFTTLEEAPTGSPQNVRVRPSGAGDLHVSWSAPTQDNWNGELLGYVISWRQLGRFDDEESDTADGRKAGIATSPGWSSSEMTIGGLRRFSRYAVSVRAYNSAGAGPPSQTTYATTADGVPEVAPTEVRCEALSARSVRVRWTPPPGPHAPALRGYDVHYAPLHFSHSWSGALSAEVARAGLMGETTLQGLRLATNYSMWVHARNDVGPGPPSTSVYCTTLEDVPSAPEAIKALPSTADAVLVSWLAPAQRGGRLSHYTLYTRELGKTGAEWSQRVEAKDVKDDVDGEATREVRGLREGTVYEFWVRGATVAGSGEPSRTVSAAPKPMVSARIASFGRVLRVAEGVRLRLRCHAVGGPPLARAWTPLPRSHTITENGDLLIHRVERTIAGNYTCSVRNNLGADSASYALRILLPPAPPTVRLAKSDFHALHVAWDPPQDGGVPLLGYTVWWSRDPSPTRSVRVPGGDTAYTLEGLACGAQYRVTLRAHNTVGVSSHSRPLIARTRGDKAKAPRGKEFIWANSTHLRFNLLTWNGRCPVSAWMVALRDAERGPWRDIAVSGEAAEVGGLRSGAWYEIRVVAKSAAGDTTALYRAATHTLNGERIGEPIELPLEASTSITDGAIEGVEREDWKTGLAPALLGGGLAALLAALATLILLKRKRVPPCLRRECSVQQVCQPHPQLYTTEPGKRNGKTLSPPDGDMHEISPYATFSMTSGGAENARCNTGCLLHLRTFGRAEPLDLAAPPSRPNLLRHSGTEEYGRSKRGSGGTRDSDSESSGSPCAECAAQLYRLPGSARAGLAGEYGRSKRGSGGTRDSDSESSGSPCAECAAQLYRLPGSARAGLAGEYERSKCGSGGTRDSDSESSGSPCAECAARLYRLPGSARAGLAGEYERSKRGSGGTRDSDSESSGSPCAECAARLYRLPGSARAGLAGEYERSKRGSGGTRDSDSESSGSPCAECAAQLYRLPGSARAGLAGEYERSKRGSGGTRDSDSESSGSPCAECAAQLYRLPGSARAGLADTLPAVESSAEDTYGVSAGSARAARPARGRRRRDHGRHLTGATARYFTSSTLQVRQDAL